jgi:hypothetical protein
VPGEWQIPITATGFGAAECGGSGTFHDISNGAEVLLNDSSGVTLGRGSLADETSSGDTSCHFSFTIATVPVAKSYALKIGTRDVATYTLADLQTKNWAIDVTLA